MLIFGIVIAWILLSFILIKQTGSAYWLDIPLFCASLIFLDSNLALNFRLYGLQVYVLLVWGIVFIWVCLRRVDIFFYCTLKNILLGVGVGLIVGFIAVSILIARNFISNGTYQAISGISLVIISMQQSIVEEMIFRLMLINYLRNFGIPDRAANIIQAVFWGALHYKSQLSIALVILSILLGWFLGILTIKRKSITFPIFIHVTINALALIMGLRA